jgi:hypothetical protein
MYVLGSDCRWENVQADPSETKNLVNESKYKELLAVMTAKLASYVPYVDGNLTAKELDNYDCVSGNGAALWDNFVGPCCQRKDTAAAAAATTTTTRGPA